MSGGFKGLLSRFLGNYVVMEYIGYGLYVTSRVKRFYLRSEAETFAQETAVASDNRVVVVREHDESVLAVFDNGRRLHKYLRKKILRR